MNQIDFTKKPVTPQLFICKPGYPEPTVLGKLRDIFNIDLKVHLGRLNELSFNVPYDVERNHQLIRNSHVDNIRFRYLIKLKLGNVEDWYLINEIDENMESDSDSKRVHAFSLGYELNDKLIREYEVTSKNATQVLTDALLDTVWSTGYIDVDFDIKFRSFEVAEKTILDFVFEIAETFGAVVDFDTVNRKINLKKQESIGTDQGLRIGYGKYAKTLGKSIKADEIITEFMPIGENGLSIRRVNPTGSSSITNFSEFLFPFQRDEQGNTIQSSHYMEDDLCHAILDYQDLVEEKKTEFSTLLSQKETHQTTLSTKQSEMSQLQIDMLIIEDELDVAKASQSDTTALLQQKTAKQTEINNKQSEIDSVESTIDNVDQQIATLQNALKLENNFTPEQIIERNKFIVRRTWTDQNFINDEDLYEEAIKRFEDLKKPQTVFNINIVNFLEVVEEQRNWDKLNLGDTITIKYEKLGIYVKAKIIEIAYNYESGDINLTIANVTEIESDENKLIKMLYQSYSTATSVDMNKYKWDETKDKLGAINDYINSEYDATKNRIIAGVNESVEISRRGLIIKNPDFPDQQLIAQSGVLALTMDGGNTWKTAVRPDGIISERLIGKIVIGVNLQMENESGKFSFTNDGVVLEGSSLTITGGLPKDQLDPTFADGLVELNKNYTNGIRIDTAEGIVVTRNDDVVKTTMNATSGIKIQKKELGVWKDKFFVDANGNLTAEDLIARKLIIRDSGGFTLINADTKTIDFTGFNVISGKENVVKGINIKNSANQTTFSVDTNGNVTVGGNITMCGGSISWSNVNTPTADQIDGLGNKLTYIDQYGIYTGTLTANQITAGSISADRISGGTIQGVTINVSTNLYVGDYIYLGTGYTGFKSLLFNNMARINSSGTDLDLNCAYLSSNASYVSFMGHVQISGTKHLDFSSYGGGWYMQDSSWIRAVNNVGIFTPGTIKGVIENISDRSMKKNIISLYDKGISALHTINNKFNVYEYHMNTQSDDSLKDHGFMADELPEEFVSRSSDKGIPDSVKTYSIVAYLTKAVQELTAEVEYLKSKQ